VGDSTGQAADGGVPCQPQLSRGGLVATCVGVLHSLVMWQEGCLGEGCCGYQGLAYDVRDQQLQ
jgi:hypothetical protein